MKVTKKLFAILMALTVACAVAAPSAAFAATSSLKAQGFTTTTSTILKKAAKVKKGTTKLKAKKGQGLVKFKATKTKTWKFTFSKLKSKGFSSNAYISVLKPEASYPTYCTYAKVKTKGGKADTLWLSANGYKSTGSGTYKTLPSRTAKLKLKKDEWVFFYLYNGKAKNTTLQLKIK